MMKNALYGLKQAPIAWYSRIDSYLTQNGFHESEIQPTLYTKFNEQGNMLTVCMYVDDLIFTSDFDIKDFRTVMEREFEMTHMGLMKCFWALNFNNLKVVYFYHIPSMQVQLKKKICLIARYPQHH